MLRTVKVSLPPKFSSPVMVPKKIQSVARRGLPAECASASDSQSLLPGDRRNERGVVRIATIARRPADRVEIAKMDQWLTGDLARIANAAGQREISSLDSPMDSAGDEGGNTLDQPAAGRARLLKALLNDGRPPTRLPQPARSQSPATRISEVSAGHPPLYDPASAWMPSQANVNFPTGLKFEAEARELPYQLYPLPKLTTEPCIRPGSGRGPWPTGEVRHKGVSPVVGTASLKSDGIYRRRGSRSFLGRPRRDRGSMGRLGRHRTFGPSE